MTPLTKDFLQDFADLLAKYDVTFSTDNYGLYFRDAAGGMRNIPAILASVSGEDDLKCQLRDANSLQI